MFWTGRAISEYQWTARTWFGTVTCSPEEHYGLEARASARLFREGVAFGELSSSEQFIQLAREMGSEMTLFLKRLRKGNGPIAQDGGVQIPHVKPQFRYLLIAEAHDSEATSEEMKGRPHFHILLHEQIAGALVVGEPIRALSDGHDGEMIRRYYKTRKGWLPGVFAADDSFLRTQWTYGHTKFQLASSANSAAYVCKYLTKALNVRVRASQGYGVERITPHNPEGIANDVSAAEK